MRIFVTGATGVVGAAVCREAIRQGHHILALRRALSVSPFTAKEEENIRWVYDDSYMKEIVYRYCPDVLIHFAWGSLDVGQRDVQSAQLDNFYLSKRMFELYPYKQIISAGSQAEYGYYTERVNEDSELNPQTQYGKAKIKTCEWLKAYCESKNIEWQWLRIFTIFGEGLRTGIIPFAIKQCLSSATDLETTSGEQVYSFLYAPDFAKSMMKVLGTKGKSGIYNVSQPYCEYPIKDVLSRIKNLTKSNINIHFGALPYRDKQVMLMAGNTSKFENAFGTFPNTPFNDALINVIESMR